VANCRNLAEWFGWLRSLCPDGEPIWLILDAYSIHRQETIRAYAEDLRIHLLFVPPGLTEELQPLDRFVFGAMKGTFRRLYRLHCEFNPAAAIDKEIVTGFLIRGWESVTTALLEGAWALYEGRHE
jgi:hypothetical protein